MTISCDCLVVYISTIPTHEISLYITARKRSSEALKVEHGWIYLRFDPNPTHAHINERLRIVHFVMCRLPFFVDIMVENIRDLQSVRRSS